MWYEAGPRTGPEALTIGLMLFLVSTVCAFPVRAETLVDVELVIAADVSISMDKEEKLLQQQGFADAMRHPAIMEAIRRGRFGRIAVTYIEWGGDQRQKVVVPWMTVNNENDAWLFASRIERNIPTRLRRGTSISSILGFSEHVLKSNGYDGARRIINISSDGMNNTGPDLDGMRANLILQGVTINGLPIVYKGLLEGVLDDAEDVISPAALISYFQHEVIGGPGAFVEPVRSEADYSRAIQIKLLREISGMGYTAHIRMPAKERPL